MQKIYSELSGYIEPSLDIAQSIQHAIKSEYRGPLKEFEGNHSFEMKYNYSYDEIAGTPRGFGNLHDISTADEFEISLEELSKLWASDSIDETGIKMHAFQITSRTINGELPSPFGEFKLIAEAADNQTSKELAIQDETEKRIMKILMQVAGIDPTSDIPIDEQLEANKKLLADEIAARDKQRWEDIDANIMAFWTNPDRERPDASKVIDEIMAEDKANEEAAKKVKTKALINKPQLPAAPFFDNRGEGNPKVAHLARAFKDTPYTSRSPGDLLTRYQLKDFDPRLQALYDQSRSTTEKKDFASKISGTGVKAIAPKDKIEPKNLDEKGINTDKGNGKSLT